MKSCWMATLQMVWQMEQAAQFSVFKCHQTRKPGVSFGCSLKIMISVKVHELWLEISMNWELILHGHQLYLRHENLLLRLTMKLPERNYLCCQPQQKQCTDHKETQYQKVLLTSLDEHRQAFIMWPWAEYGKLKCCIYWIMTLSKWKHRKRSNLK